MRKECVFSWKRPWLQMTGTNLCLLDIVSWDLHLGHFLSDRTYQQHSDVLCFTETHTRESSPVRIENFNPCWKTIHHPTSAHGLAICFNTGTVIVEKEYDPISDIDMSPVFLRLDQSLVLLVLVYRPPNGPRNVFIEKLKQQLSLIKEVGRYRTIVLGDFNTDQMLPENMNAYQNLCQQHNFTQR